MLKTRNSTQMARGQHHLQIMMKASNLRVITVVDGRWLLDISYENGIMPANNFPMIFLQALFALLTEEKTGSIGERSQRVWSELLSGERKHRSIK